jgi:hypothetical protein
MSLTFHPVYGRRVMKMPTHPMAIMVRRTAQSIISGPPYYDAAQNGGDHGGKQAPPFLFIKSQTHADNGRVAQNCGDVSGKGELLPFHHEKIKRFFIPCQRRNES